MTFPNKSFFKISFTFLILAVLTRLPFFWETYLHSDEALFGLSSQIWNLGGLPYRDFFETKPLGIYVFYRFASWIMGAHPTIDIQRIHFFTIFWTLATAGTLYQIAKELYSEKTGYWAGILFILFSSFWGPDIISTHIEVVLILPLCLACFYLGQYPKKNSLLMSFVAGFFASAAFLCKYQAGIFLPQAFLYIFLAKVPQGLNSISRRAFHCLILLLGFLPLIGFHFLYLFQKGTLQDFLFWNLEGNFSYIQAGHQAVIWGDILFQLTRHFISSFFLWILTFFYIRFFCIHRTSLSTQQKNSFLFLMLWLLLMWIPVATGKRFEDHYFLLLIPPLCVIAAQALIEGSWLTKRKWQFLTLFFLLTPTLGFTLSRYFLHDSYRIWGGEDMSLYQPYANFIENKTSASDRIFIWGCTPSIYLLANRLPATRFLRTDNLAGRIAGLGSEQNNRFQEFITPGAWEMFFEDVGKYPPLYILDTATAGLHDFQNYPLTAYPQIKEFLEKFYEREPSFQGVSVYRRRNPL